MPSSAGRGSWCWVLALSLPVLPGLASPLPDLNTPGIAVALLHKVAVTIQYGKTHTTLRMRPHMIKQPINEAEVVGRSELLFKCNRDPQGLGLKASTDSEKVFEADPTKN